MIHTAILSAPCEARTLARPQGLVRSTWALPVLLALLSLLGLVTALTGDGAADLLAWVTLAVPVVAVCWAMHTRRR